MSQLLELQTLPQGQTSAERASVATGTPHLFLNGVCLYYAPSNTKGALVPADRLLTLVTGGENQQNMA